MSFPAILLTKTNAAFGARATTLDDTELHAQSPGDVVVDIEYSGLNYKDALALTDAGPVVRQWPMVPGIDGAGYVISSAHPAWRKGDRVLLNGWGCGETHWGCLAGRARLSGDWLVSVPDEFTNAQAMAIGTAGYTAMLCIMALEDAGVALDMGEVLVTGASGGVGSVAVSLLSSMGCQVAASTGKLDEHEYLRSLGATQVVPRQSLSEPGKPLQKERWTAVIDSVGSHTLANALAQTRYGGAVAACGLAQGMELPGSVAPFILRGIRLLGVDSVMCPSPRRRRAWERLASQLDVAKLDALTTEVPMASVFERAEQMLQGKVKGRTVVRIS